MNAHLENSAEKSNALAPSALVHGIQLVPLDAIMANPYQPRQEFSSEEIEDLAKSIAQVGLLQPPLVRKVPGQTELFELVSGERRVRACRLLGLRAISVYMSDKEELSDVWQAEAALIENIQRVDLNPIETALAIERLMSLQKATQEEISEKVGKKRSTISNYLRLLKLPHNIQEEIRRGKISFAHAKVLLSSPNEEIFKNLSRYIILNNWPVKRCEEYIRSNFIDEERAENLLNRLQSKKKKPFERDLFLQEIIRNLESRFHAKVEILPVSKGGTILIHYASADHLDSLLEQWGISSEE